MTLAGTVQSPSHHVANNGRPGPDEAEAIRQSSLARLTTLLSLVEGAWAVAVFEATDVQRQVVRDLRAQLAPLPIVEISLANRTPDPLAIMTDLDLADQAPVLVFSDLITHADQLSGYLDVQRESLARQPYRLLFLVTQHSRSILAQRAPNFYSRLNGVFYFPGSRQTSQESLPIQSAAFQPGASGGTVPALAMGRRRPSISPGTEKERQDLVDFQQRRINELKDAQRPDLAAIGDSWYDMAGLLAQAMPRQWLQAEVAYGESARAYAQAGLTLAGAEALYQAGDAAMRGYAPDMALTHLEQARRLYILLTDTIASTPDAVLGEANVLQAQGDVLYFQKETAAALEKYELALGLYRGVGDRLGEANVLQAQGDVLRQQGDYSESSKHYQSALAMYQAIGDRQGEANSCLGLGRLALVQEQWSAARPWLERASSLHSANGDRFGVALDSVDLAQACQALEDIESALSALQQAATNFAAIGLLDRALGIFAQISGLLEEAERHEEALAISQHSLHLQPGAAWLVRNVANNLINLNRLDQAAAHLDQAEALDPDSPYLPLRRAELAKARNHPADTARWAQLALDRQPDWADAQTLLTWATTPQP